MLTNLARNRKNHWILTWKVPKLKLLLLLDKELKSPVFAPEPLFETSMEVVQMPVPHRRYLIRDRLLFVVSYLLQCLTGLNGSRCRKLVLFRRTARHRSLFLGS
jgi:hypothetical protein